MNYDQFRNEVFRRYSSGNYGTALEMIERQASAYPDNQGQMLYWRACIEGQLDQPEAAIHSLKRMVDLGLWLDPEFVRSDTDLAILAGRNEFENILAVFAARQAEARSSSRPRLLILQPAASTPSPYPLVIAIHGRNDNARNFTHLWRPMTELGWLVALPQSSLTLGSDSFGWDDLAQAEVELADHFRRLENDYQLDDTRIMVAGFSQGGGLSIWLTLTQGIPATGFLAMAPYLHNLDTLAAPTSLNIRARGVVASGDQDSDQAMFDQFEGRLAAAGIAYQRIRYPDLAHEIPADFPKLLKETLEYLYA